MSPPHLDFDDGNQQVEKERHEVAYGISATSGGAAALDCPSLGRQILPEEVSAMVLQGIFREHLGSTPARYACACSTCL